jgi:lysophospholipase L1-like esterase
MNSNLRIAKQGNNAQEAANRLGKLIDKMIKACPDATILVSMIIDTCGNAQYKDQNTRTEQYRNLIPDVVKKRRDDKHHVLAVDFSEFSTKNLRSDCVHPSNDGYKLMGDWWYDFIHQIPKDWIKDPVGKDPNHGDSIDANGGLDKNIPAPDWGTIPIRQKSQSDVSEVAS